MNGRKIRVGVNGHDLKFWYPLQRALEATGRYEFREDVWTGHNSHDPGTSRNIIDWADVIISEWALGNAVFYSKNKRRGQRHLVRLHLQERETSHPGEIDYENVDRIVFVGEHIQRECIRKFGIPPSKCLTLGNFVDVDRYDQTKMGGSEFTLGIIGTAPSRKRLDLAIDVLELLLEEDPRYRLRVKGVSPGNIPWLWARTKERKYYEEVYERINSAGLRHHVIFDPPGADVHHWLRMVGAILSPSDYESFHMAVAEGASSGCFPIIWNWDGASDIYPEFQLVSSAREAAAQIRFLNSSASGPRYREQVKRVIRERYDSGVICGLWDALISDPGSSPSARKTSPKPARLLVVWAIDGWSTFHRREMLEALSANLEAGFQVLVIEPGNHRGTIEQLKWASAEELDRIARGELLECGSNIFRTRLLCGEAANGLRNADDPLDVLDQLTRKNFGKAMDTLHWVYKPDQALKLNGRRFVYEVYDDYTFDFGTGTPLPDIMAAEQRVIPMAEHVFFTSKPLMDRKAAGARSSSLVGNGVNFQPFARFRPQRDQRVGRPVAGYLGNLSDFFDWQLMHQVCRSMPDVDFVFHGQIESEKLGAAEADYLAMRGLPNVVFTGRVSRSLGATSVGRYDVLMIPFAVNDAMHAVNPLKLWEYYATGCPIVMTPMEAVDEPNPLVIVAEGVDAWIAAIRRCLDDEDAGHEKLVEQRLARGEAHRWDRVMDSYVKVLMGSAVDESDCRLGAVATAS